MYVALIFISILPTRHGNNQKRSRQSMHEAISILPTRHGNKKTRQAGSEGLQANLDPTYEAWKLSRMTNLSQLVLESRSYLRGMETFFKLNLHFYPSPHLDPTYEAWKPSHIYPLWVNAFHLDPTYEAWKLNSPLDQQNTTQISILPTRHGNFTTYH